jgi:hypothetical protein
MAIPLEHRKLICRTVRLTERQEALLLAVANFTGVPANVLLRQWADAALQQQAMALDHALNAEEGKTLSRFSKCP